MRMSRRMGLWGGGEAQLPVGTTWFFDNYADRIFTVPCTAQYQITSVGAGGNGGSGGDAYYQEGTDMNYAGAGGGGGSSSYVIQKNFYLTEGTQYTVRGQYGRIVDLVTNNGGRRGGDASPGNTGTKGASAGTGSNPGTAGSPGGSISNIYSGTVSGGAGGAGGQGYLYQGIRYGGGGAGGKGGDVISGTLGSGSSGNWGSFGMILIELVSFEPPTFRTITISNDDLSQTCVIYNTVSYTSGTLSARDGDIISIQGDRGKTVTINLNGTRVARGWRVTYDLAITADATIAINSSTVNITM